MKNQILLFLCLAAPLNAINSGQLSTDSLKIDKTIQEYTITHKDIKLIEHYRNLLIGMMAQESATGQNMIGDGGNAKGILQMHKSFVDNINKLYNTKYTYEDRMNPSKSLEMFLLYQQKYNPTGDYQRGAMIWNGGQNADLTNPRLINYWESVKTHIDNKSNLLLANTIIEGFKNNV